MEDKVQEFLARGYIEVPTDSGTGSRILINANSGRVAKFNQDQAYAQFADFCLVNPNYAVPKIYSHEYPLGRFSSLSNDQYSIAQMELLEALSHEEQLGVVSWIENIFNALRRSTTLAECTEDPFGLMTTFKALHAEAQRLGVKMDVLKSTNYLKRSRGLESHIVFSDPFN